MSSLLLFLSHLPTIGFLKAQKVCWFHRELGGVVLSSGRGRAATMLCKTESTVGRLPREKAGCSTTACGGGKLEAGGTKQHGPWEGLISFPTLLLCQGSRISHCVKWGTSASKMERNMGWSDITHWLLCSVKDKQEILPSLGKTKVLRLAV